MGTIYPRRIGLRKMQEKRSFFLFGPRVTVKSTLLRRTPFEHVRIFDLLDAETFQRLLRRPAIMAEETTPETVVVLDEIQRLPMLLDEVHRLIDHRR